MKFNEETMYCKDTDEPCRSSQQRDIEIKRKDTFEPKQTKKKPLSDKIREPCSLGTPNNIKVDDVKEAIKEIKEDMNKKFENVVRAKYDIDEIIDKRIGKRLI